MASGLDTASGVFSVIELAIALFHGVVKTIALISAARHAGQDIARVRFMLQWEEFRLLQWADRVGLGNDDPDPTIINWTLAYDLIDHLNKDLSSAQTLKEKYNLISIDVEEHLDGTITENGPAAASFFDRLQAHATKKMLKIRERAIDKGTTAYKNLKWAGFDHKKTRQLLDDVRTYNNYLRDLLDDVRQDFVSAGVAALLRDLVSRSSNNTDLDVVNAVLDMNPSQSQAIELKPAIAVKYTRLMAGIDRRKDEKWVGTAQNPRLSRIKYENLSLVTATGRDNCETAVYKVSNTRKSIHSYVLLEWKSVPKARDSVVAKRIMELTFLLSTAAVGFHTLKCLGFVKRELPANDFNKYAYVFEIVDLLHLPKAELKKLQTLRSVIDTGVQLSLTRRISMATTIAQTVLQLHTAGWMHKNICAESIVFLKSATTDALSSPVVCGFEFARLTVEDTEAVPPDPVAELYRHPSYQGGGGAKGNGFRKIYDLYSLGCVLLEILLWSSFEDILYSVGRPSSLSSDPVEDTTADKTPQQLAHERRMVVLKGRSSLMEKDSMRKISDRVAFHAGDQASKAIELCFFPIEHLRSFEDEHDPDEDFLELSVDPQMRIVELFQSLTHV